MTWTLVFQILALAVIGTFTFAILWGVTRQSKSRITLSADEHAALIEAKRVLSQNERELDAITLNELHKRIGEAA